MSATPPPPPGPSSWGPLLPAVVAPPPRPVRTAIVLVWVQLAVGVMTTLALFLVPGVRDQVLAPAENAPGLPPDFGRVLLVVVVVSAVGGLLVAAAYATVVTVFLRRGHRWVRVVILVFASLAAFGLVTVVLQAVIYALMGPSLLVQVAPSPLTVVSSVVGTAFYVAIVVLLFHPASRRWLDERTVPRRWAAQQRWAAAGGADASR